MKKNVFFLRAGVVGLCVVVLGTGVSVDAQGQMGIKGGLSFANLGGAKNLDNEIQAVVPSADPGSLLWWTASVWSAHDLLPNLVALQMELTYWRGGKSWNGMPGGDDDDFKLEIDYLQIPLMLKVLVPIATYIVPNLYVGPQISLAFRARARNINQLPEGIELISPFFNGLDQRSSIIDYAVNTFDAGFVAGAGFQLPSKYGNFDFDFRYIFGGLNTFNFPEATEIRNYAFLLMAGYSVNFGGKCP